MTTHILASNGANSASIFSQPFLDSLEESITDVAHARTLPPELYTSQEFFHFEQDKLWSHEWLCLGLESQIPQVGDYFSTEIAG